MAEPAYEWYLSPGIVICMHHYVRNTSVFTDICKVPVTSQLSLRHQNIAIISLALSQC